MYHAIFLFLIIIQTQKIYEIEKKKDVNWSNGVKSFYTNNFDKFFFRYNENFIIQGKTFNDNECGMMIGNEICLKNFNFLKSSCFKAYKNHKSIATYFGNVIPRINFSLFKKLIKFKGKNASEAKKYKLKLSKKEVIKFRTCVFKDLYNDFRKYYYDNKRETCYQLDYEKFDNLPLEVKTSVMALTKKLPTEFKTNSLLRKNVNHNILNCNFKELANNFKFMASKSKNKIFYSNISDILASLENQCTKGIKLKLVFLIDESGSITYYTYFKFISFISKLIDRIYNPGLEVGVIFFSNNINFELKLQHYDKEVIKKQLVDRFRVTGGTNTFSALDKALNMVKTKYSKNDLIPPHILLFSDGYSNKPSQTIKKAKEIHNVGYTISVVKVGDFRRREVNLIKSKDGVFFSLKHIDQLDSILRTIENKSCKIHKEIKLDNNNNSLRNDKNNVIPKNTEIYYKITLPKSKLLEVELKEDNNGAKTNNILGTVIGSVNYSNPNCIVNNVEKVLQKNNNKIYMSYDLAKSWNSNNLSTKNCSFDSSIQLKNGLEYENSDQLEKLFNKAKKSRNANDDLTLTRNEDYLLFVENNNSNYTIYLRIKTDNDSKLKLNLKLHNKNVYNIHQIKNLNKDNLKPPKQNTTSSLNNVPYMNLNNPKINIDYTIGKKVNASGKKVSYLKKLNFTFNKKHN